MKTIKNLVWFAFFTSLFLVSCVKDDESNQDQKDGKITSLTDPDYDAKNLKGNIEGSFTLPAGEYVITGALVVKNGFTLTVSPGSTFKAVAGGTDVYVAVEQGAKMIANGTALAPIVFTSNSGNPRSGDWGGLLIMGYAPISGGGTATTEVVSFTYGGTDAADNSGSYKYIKVEYSGARINGEKEFNGLTFYGVGNGTVVENIASLYGDDDAIEFFGGSVNVTNLLVVNAKDDMIDWTQGYKGTISNAYCIREAGYNDVTEDPRGIEADGNLDGNNPSHAGQSDATVNGLTIVSNSVVSLSDIIKIRRGSKATISNTLVLLGNSAVAPGDLVDCTDSKGDAAAGTTITLIGSGTNLDLNDNKAGANNATINTSAGTTGGANTTLLTWTNYTF